MDDNTLLAALAVLLCTLLNFFFTLAEASLVTMGRLRIGFSSGRDNDENSAADDAKPGPSSNGSEGLVHELLADPTRIIAAVQVAITVFSLASLSIVLLEFGPILGHFFSRWMNHKYAAEAAVACLVTLIAVVNLVIGEIVPRAIAARYPNEVGRIVAKPLHWLEWTLHPCVAVLLAVSNLIIRPFGMTASFNSAMMTEEELRVLLEAGQSEGVIEEDEKEMLHNVISFGDTQAHAVMTPRVDMCAIEASQPLSRLIDLIVDHGHSRIPVYENTIDSIIGVVHAKDLLPGVLRGMQIEGLRQIMREPTFVPEHLPIDDLLAQMRRSNTQLAIVQDEYGGTAGLVTIEDLLEEIVGEIQDEYDPEQTMVETDLQTGASLVDARMTIDDVNDELNLSLPTVDFDTIGGLVFGLIGRPPAPGDKVETTLGADGELTVRFKVTKADGRRLQQVSIESFPTPSEADGEVKDASRMTAES